ncbi:MAG: glycine--tRNA ligase [Candidatus Diapherotrites archaeon]|nr:glycine--tRNA ligase [Candidatus Diapherotrites archaeon]
MADGEKMKSIDEVTAFCKRRGFVFPSCDIYGGLSGFWDFGPVGVELKNNIKSEWWNSFVVRREDVVGVDGSIVNSHAVWKASGHVDGFTDPLLDCKKCKNRVRADQLIEDKLEIPADGMSLEEIDNLVKEKNIKCPNCGGEFGLVHAFNLMFKTFVGPVEDTQNTAYLRPETAQLIFTNFKLVQESSRMKLPFGIAQTGKAFRNEISPRDFVFRSREFEQMELEYFIHPDTINDCPFLDSVSETKISFLTAEAQSTQKTQEKEGKGKKQQKTQEMTIREAVKKGLFKTKWHAYWLATMHNWFTGLGVKAENLRVRQHLEKELSHYSLETWDIEYNFPFGWKEIHGMANRTTFDLTQHSKASGESLTYFDEESKTRITPYVVSEPSQGVERAFLTFIVDAFEVRDGKNVLKIHPKLAPYKAAVFPLVKKDGLPEKARQAFEELLENGLACAFDDKGSIGKRYARHDEIGTPFCITFDSDSLKDNTVTLRDRDTAQQKRVEIEELPLLLLNLISGKKIFSEI